METHSTFPVRSMVSAGEPVSPWPHGVLNVNKPFGWTSHDVVMRLRRVFGITQIGHAGTLDPPATGVLPVLVGKGTKIAQYLLNWDKEYAAVLRLGQRTDTQDATGTVLQEVQVEGVPEKRIRSTILEFQGAIQQIPPMFSAVKIKGRPLYEAARKGLTIERSARSVTVKRLEIMDIRGEEVDLRIICSKGTYIRTLCADIGDRLEVGGHLQWLERRRVGPLHIDQALRVEEISKQSLFSEHSPAFLSLDQALEGFPSVIVGAEHAEKVMHGHSIPIDDTRGQVYQEQQSPGEEMVRIKDSLGRLIAIGLVHLTHQAGTGMQPRISVRKVFVEEGAT